MDDLLVAGGAGGAALLLWGEPGIGKTALLDYAAERATAGTSGAAPGTILRARGIETETVLPFATLGDLLMPHSSLFRELPGVQRSALESCLALSGDPADPPGNPYAACMGALNVLAALGDERPVVILVDDLHWVDPSSLRVLLFVARRLSSERVALALGSREDHGESGPRRSIPTVQVGGLAPEECATLLDGRVTPHVLADLVRISGGNPLALREIASGLTDEQARGERPLLDPPSLGSHLERAWAARIDGLPDTARRALVVLAAGRSTAAGPLRKALEAAGLSLDALSPAEEDGLITATADGLDFHHPVLRALVLGRAPLAHRYAAFQALAEVSTGPLHAWYRASATPGPDEETAAALAEAAREARRRSAFGESALAWRRAAELTPDPAPRADRLHHAASDALLSGSPAGPQWCEEALRITPDPAVRAAIQGLLGRMYTWKGETAQAYGLLLNAADAVRDTDRTRACLLLAEATAAARLDGHVPAAVRVAEESLTLASESGPERWYSLTLLGGALVMAGRTAEGREMLEAADRHGTGGDPVRDQQVYAIAGQAWSRVEEFVRGRRLLNTAVESARRHSAVGVLGFTLAVRGELETRIGQWAPARGDLTEALRWAEELGQLTCVSYALYCLARLEALRGDRVECEEHVARARRECGAYGIGCQEFHMTAVLGLSALAHGDHDAAADQLEQTLSLAVEQGIGNPEVVPFAADLAEAHVRAGNAARAAEVVSWLEERVRETGLASAEAAAARVRGLLAGTPQEAEACFGAALKAHHRTTGPFDWARTLLCEAEVLRRYRRPGAARAPLASALACFERLGAVPWARRAASELAAAGGMSSTARSTAGGMGGALNQLTPQEFQVSRAIARGLNNTEAAASLFVSRKTVEAHLTRIYRKLRVRSRTDLTRLLTAADLVD
ncbi:LuxR C-terminal-related transcriptional regulator [Streptomyces europaeiscabiei]|uniref:LuxR family transcriptional regulator n=3 Tax=Streptomyces europaeiscabiei TaxID=146819 RepID=UPI000AC60906|nr:LuxR family transcriptional regulator [Streptomyces europaeiscabiei]MDX3848358.1 LuxR C-terminal-related transcriptional regulator [Streptomyces europaeiscabiei]MDX3861033.1 LuxR C-terminal-related transcriptional regulator [Streptomyces europaeiscabiei]MDX3873579.1 LuxR C-terminal-related transcriptional regulator [Streptomyces europaeiscabiei]